MHIKGVLDGNGFVERIDDESSTLIGIERFILVP